MRRSRTRWRSPSSNRVILINRNEEFARCKEGNLALVLKAIKDGRLDCRYGTSAAKVERVGGRPAARFRGEDARRART